MVRKLILCLFLLAFQCVCYGRQEEILDFVSNITINIDASADVTEEITVYADQTNIKHGIVRWLPRKLTDSYGITHKERYSIQNILVNNKKSAYHTEFNDNQLVIYIGDKDTYITPGIYIYTLKYHINNIINFLKDADEFYWNVTGNDWKFTIQQSKAIINLPQQVSIKNYTGYTGEFGAHGTNYQVTVDGNNKITFESTQPLYSGENLTIAVSWNKGVIQQPGYYAEPSNKAQLITFEIIIISVIYYMIAWYMVGRDPNKGTIIPLFEPPPNISPASMRFIYQMGFDMKTFTTAIISMATKGYITIIEDNHKYTLTKTTTDTKMLSTDETVLANKLFEEDTIELDKKNYKIINEGKTAIKNTLIKEYENIYFVTNLSYLIPGIIFGLLALGAVIIAAEDHALAFFSALWIAAWALACYSLILNFISNVKLGLSSHLVWKFISTIFSFIFSIPIMLIGIGSIIILSESISSYTLYLLVIIVFINILFHYLLKAPTKQGRILMDQIDGFRQFVNTTDRYRLNQLNPPDVTPEIFEKYLPYAVALDVEVQWSKKFNDYLQSSTETKSYQPVWYAGSNWNSFSIVAFSSQMSTNLSNTLSSSSASGGGGSSGGGGGGGGGGGW